MRARIAFVLALLALLTGVNLAGTAHAAPQAAPVQTVARPTATQYVYHVPPITCESLDACQWSFNANGSLQGYWMARRFDHPGLWVRLTMVAGWNNDQAAPITCAVEDQCVIDYYWPVGGGLGNYIMGRQWNGTKWVRMSLIPGTGT